MSRLVDDLHREADKLQELGLGLLAHELRVHARDVNRAESALAEAKRSYPRRKREQRSIARDEP